MTIYTVCDFFCGAGGFSEGFRQAGMDVMFSLDSWKLATETHDVNHSNHKCVHMSILDINTVEEMDKIIPDTDIIVGSPPCIAFSNSNKAGKADKTLGIQLINQYLKIILYKMTKKGSKLKYWILENVPNSIDYIKDEYTAKELGLDEKLPNLKIPIKQILVASDYGAPQGRKRAIIGNYIIPPKTHVDNPVKINVIQSVLGSPLNNTKKSFTDPLFKNIKLNKKQLTDHFYNTDIPQDMWKKAKRLKTDHGYMGKMEFPDSTNRLSRTIMATESYCSREAIIFKKENTENEYRGPTIREISSLMGFPIDYQFKGSHNNKHKQIGNAVCVQLSKALGDAIIMNDKINRKKVEIRHNETAINNFNDLENGILSNYVPKPKKINSKFHIHVPHMKIAQMRVELDNTESNFNDEKFIWKSYLHKGSGKNAIKLQFSNEKLKELLNSDTFSNFKKELKKLFTKNIYDSTIFQKKNCNIPIEDKHFAPYESLELIETTVNKYVNDEKINSSELDTLLKYNKPNNYSLKVLYSLYGVNLIETLLK